LAFQLADTPAGSPLNELIPVAPVVVIVILFVNGVLIHSVGDEEAALAVFAGVTMMVPVADTVPQPPLNGIE
jgi:hypothetical protein